MMDDDLDGPAGMQFQRRPNVYYGDDALMASRGRVVLGAFWAYTPGDTAVELAVVAITRDKLGADVTLLNGASGRTITTREEWMFADPAWESIS